MSRPLSQAATLGHAAGYMDTASITASHFASVRFRLERGQDSVIIAIIGDSTGAGTTAPNIRWVWQFAHLLAAKYPAYTVNFRPYNVTNTAYDPTIVIQTGTGKGNSGGPFVLDIYNGSASGKDPYYSQLNGFTLIPNVTPDLVIFNHGHNMSTSDADIDTKSKYYAMVRDVIRWFAPHAGIVAIGQNPRTDANASIQYERVCRIRELAGGEGWGFVNVMQAFLDSPNWQSLINSTDGIHPTDAGSALWAATVWKAFQNSTPYTSPAGSSGSADDRFVVPGATLVPSLVVGGAPAVGAVNSFIPAMGFSKQASPIGASAMVHLPNAWREVNIWAYWTTSDGAAGNVAWRLDTCYITRIGTELTSGSNGSALALSTGSVFTGAAPSAAYAQSHTLLEPSQVPYQFVGSRNLILRVVRDGSNAGDTYAGTAQLIGLVIERAG